MLYNHFQHVGVAVIPHWFQSDRGNETSNPRSFDRH